MTESNAPETNAPESAESNAAAAIRIRSQLIERWPELFNEHKPVPLAIGISEALLEAMPGVLNPQLRRVLAPWCKRPRYLLTLTAGAKRHGLEGVQGEVTEEQAADAAEQLKVLQAQFKAKAEAKRKAEQAAQAAAKKKAEEAKKKAEEAEAKKAKQAEPKPKPKPAQPQPAAAKPAPEKTAPAKPAGPAIIVKKRRFTPPS